MECRSIAGDKCADGVRSDAFNATETARFSSDELSERSEVEWRVVGEVESSLEERFVDIVSQTRAGRRQDSVVQSGLAPSSDARGVCSEDARGYMAVNMPADRPPSGRHDKQQNHVTSVFSERRGEIETSNSRDVVMSPGNSASAPEESQTAVIESSPANTDRALNDRSGSDECQVTGIGVSERSPDGTGFEYGDQIDHGEDGEHSRATAAEVGQTGDGLASAQRLSRSPSTTRDPVSTDMVDFSLDEMVDARRSTSFGDLMTNCQELFCTSAMNTEQTLMQLNSEADCVSMVVDQLMASSETNSCSQSSTPISQDNSTYANSENDPDENKEPWSYELQQGYRILREIMAESNKSINWPFMNPIDSTQEGCEGYYEQVKQPMWLKKMRDKFDNHEYKNITEFVADMRLMLENCYRYNGPDHSISKKGQRLETMMEQKLALLSRELREKTSIAATSGKPLEETKITGTRRRKVIIPHDSTALLNQLRLEAQEREKEARRQLILERKQAQEAYQQELNNWEQKLLGDDLLKQMKSMWELPQIGHFLFLCAVPLNIGVVVQWELERCFLLPRESSTMQRVMTTLLSTPYQRTRLDRKPMMPYKVWEEKLRIRLRQWYKTLQDYGLDINKASEKLGLEAKFFQVIGLHSPLEKKCYHELSYYQRVWLVKGLCDWCLENQDSIREAIETQPITEQRPFDLGTDADGYNYLHFPQFCGADLRIYKQAPVKMEDEDEEPKQVESPKKVNNKVTKLTSRRKTTTPKNKVSTTRPRDSRLRQNPRQISQFQVICSDSEDETSTQRSSTVDTTTDLDSGQESIAQDSGTSEESDNNEPPSKTARSTDSQLDKGTDLSLDLLIDATPSRLTRSLMRNLTKVFSSTSTPSVSRESSPNHSGRSHSSHKTNARLKKPPKSSRESTPSARSDARSVDGSSCGQSAPKSTRNRQRKRTKKPKKARNCGTDKDNQSFDKTDTSTKCDADADRMDEKMESDSATPSNGENRAKAEENESDSSSEQERFQQTSEELEEKEKPLQNVDSPSANGNNRIKTELQTSCVEASHSDQVVTDDQPVKAQGNSLAVNDVSSSSDSARKAGIPNASTGMLSDVPCSPGNAIDKKCLPPSDCECRSEEASCEISQGADMTEHCTVSGKSCKYDDTVNNLMHESKCDDDKADLSNPDLNKPNPVSEGGFTTVLSRNPSPMDIEGDEVNKGVDDLITERSSPSLTLPECSPAKQAMEDEISLASTISAVDPSYRPDSPQYQNLPHIRPNLDDGDNNDGDEDLKPGCEILDRNAQDDQSCAKGSDENKAENKVKVEPSESQLGRLSECSVDDQKPKTECSELEPDGHDQKGDKTCDVKAEDEAMEIDQYEVVLPEFDKFELVVTDLDSLRQLIAKVAEPNEPDLSENKKPKITKVNSNKRCITELHNRLKYLLQELEPWEQKLNSLRKKAIVKMKKEQETYVEEPEKEEIEDVWESEESGSNSSESEDDESSKEEQEEEEEKTEEKEEDSDTVGVTTRGGLKRKKKVVSNDSAKKKKLPETTKEHAVSSSPNILQKKPADRQPSKVSSSSSSLSVSCSQPEKSKEAAVAIVGNQPMLLTASQLSNLKNALVLAQLTNKSSVQGVVPQIALLSNNGSGGNVLLTTQNPTLSQDKNVQEASTSKADSVVTGTQLHVSSHQQVLFGNNTPLLLAGSQPLILANPSQLTELAGSQQQLLISPPRVTVASGSPCMVTTQATKSSATADPSKPAVTCFNYSNISQLPADVIQNLLKTQEQRMQQVQPPGRSLASMSSSVMSTVSSTNTTAFTKLMKAGLLPTAVAASDARSSIAAEQKSHTSPALSSALGNTMIGNKPALSTPASVTASRTVGELPAPERTAAQLLIPSCSTDGTGLAQNSPKATRSQINLLPTLNKSMSDQPTVPNLAIIQNPTLLQEEPSGKESTRLTLLNSPPKPKYASNVTVKTLLENKHAQQKVMPTQTSHSSVASAQASVSSNSEDHNPVVSSQTKPTDSAKTVLTSVAKVTSSQPAKGIQLPNDQGQLHVLQGMGGQMQLLLPGKQQLVMSKPGKQVQLSPATAGKVQLVQGPNGQLHLLQPAIAGSQGAQLMQGAAGMQGVQLVQGPAGIQVVQTQQVPKLQVIQGASGQQQLQVIQMPTGQKLQLVQNPGVINKAPVQPSVPLPKPLIKQMLTRKVTTQLATNPNDSPQLVTSQKVAEVKEIKNSRSEAEIPVSSVVDPSTASKVITTVPSTALVGQKPKMIHIGASGQKVIPLTPQVAAQLQVAMARKQAIDQAVKTVITSVVTSLPTACIKVSSPFEMPSRRPHRSVTITTPAMKAPIPAVCKESTDVRPICSTALTPSLSSPQTNPVCNTSPASGVQLTLSTVVVPKSPTKMLNASAVTNALLAQVTCAAAEQLPRTVTTSTDSLSKPQPSIGAVPSVTEPGSPPKNVGLRLTPQNILTSRGVVQGVIVPPGVVLSQIILQQLKQISDTQGLAVFQQTKGDTLQQLFPGNRQASVEQLTLSQQPAIKNVRPPLGQPLVTNQLAMASVQNNTQQLASSPLAQVNQVPKQLAAVPQQLVANVGNNLMGKMVIANQEQLATKVLQPGVQQVQMVLQAQPQQLAAGQLKQVTQSEKPLQAVIPAAPQLLRNTKALLTGVQLQQVVVTSGQPAVVQVAHSLTSLPASQTAAAVSQVPLVGRPVAAGLAVPGMARQLIQLPAAPGQLAKSPVIADGKQMVVPKRHTVSGVVQPAKTVAITAGVLMTTLGSASLGSSHTATTSQSPNTVASNVANSNQQPSQNEPPLSQQQQQQVLQLIHNSQVQVRPEKSADQNRAVSASVTQMNTAVNLIRGSAPRQPSKLVVFNVNGKLMTAQGMPVNLTQGLVKVGNQVIGAQAGLRNQQTAAQVRNGGAAGVLQLISNPQQLVTSESVQLSSSVSSTQPAGDEGLHAFVSAANLGSGQAGQGDADMHSGLQVLANAANMSAVTKGQ